MTLPFSGLRVIDLTTVIAGPYCTYQLALLGAEVIKVETPNGGDLARRLGADPALNALDMGASYLGMGAGKRSVTLNLKSGGGVEIFRRLTETADVLVENFRPGVMARLGLDYETLRAIRPGLIYCAITGFGQHGTYREKPAYDQIVQGLSGAMSATGDAASGPMRSGYPISDTVAGINAAFAIAAALTQRLRDEAGGDGGAAVEGQFIDVSMLDSVFSIMGWVTTNYLIAHQPPVPSGNDNFTASPSGSFRARDGLINIAANNPTQFKALCEALGLPELAADPRFAGPEERLQHREALTAELEKVLCQRDGNQWVERLNAAGVPSGPVLTLEQAMALPPVKERGSVRRIDSVPGLERPIDVFTAGFQLSGGAPQVGNPPPRLGADTEAVLSSLGYSEEEIAGFRDDGAI